MGAHDGWPNPACQADTGDDAVDQFLFDMHRWAYVGMIQMGLLCAVLMHQEGNPAKRQLMQMRGPVLLHPEFLSRAKDVIQQASLDPKERARLCEEGIFFATESSWSS